MCQLGDCLAAVVLNPPVCLTACLTLKDDVAESARRLTDYASNQCIQSYDMPNRDGLHIHHHGYRAGFAWSI